MRLGIDSRSSSDRVWTDFGRFSFSLSKFFTFQSIAICKDAFLNLRCLLFKTRSERLYCFLLLRDRGLEVLVQLLNLAVFFEKLVKQHRVHRFIADGVDFAVLVAHHQVWVHLGHFLGY